MMVLRNLPQILRKRTTVPALAGWVVLMSMSLPASQAYAACAPADEFRDTKLTATCLTPTEAMTVRMRIFRAELAVAALSCDQQSQYNRLVTTHQDILVKGGKALRALFNRLHQSQATRQLNKFVTHLSNRASLRRLAARGYCAKMAAVFNEAVSLPSQELMPYIQSRPIRTALAQPLPQRTLASAKPVIE